MRKLLITLVVLAVLLVAADFGARAFAESKTADAVQNELELTTVPNVSIEGAPLPAEHFRDFNNAGPTVAFGIESPGHFAEGGANGGSGSYTASAVGGGTYGMAGIYTAKVGGLWDGLLGEGRNFFIYVSSD